MMYIAPNTIIKILKNCPLDNTYEHTIYFDSVAEQTNYFNSLAKYTLNSQTYQRVQKGSMRVAYKAEDLYDCNYLMFQNTSFGNKWFYAFILGVEYVNNITSEITFEIDVMQTWHFDYTPKECFVEREHTVTDRIGENTLPENLETGPYANGNATTFNFPNLSIFIMATEKIDVQSEIPIVWNDPGIVGKFPVPCYWALLGTINTGVVTALKDLLDVYAKAGKADAIINVFTAPTNVTSLTENISVNIFKGPERRLLFEPKNYKLYSYPYTSLVIKGLGQAVELRYELFSTTEPAFFIRSGFGANMQVICSPTNYNGYTEDYEHSITIKDFPLCAWVTDYYQNWLAQNKASIVLNTITGAAIGVAGIVAKSPSMAGSGFTQVANQMVSVYEHSIVPDKMAGAGNAADILAVSGVSGFYADCKTILPEYGKIIDDYFTMYGYKVNAVKVPNRKVRPFWTFTKTSRANIVGSVPADDMKKICSIYDNGITFWTDGNNIGNYELDNRPAVRG